MFVVLITPSPLAVVKNVVRARLRISKLPAFTGINCITQNTTALISRSR